MDKPGVIKCLDVLLPAVAEEGTGTESVGLNHDLLCMQWNAINT